MKKLSLLFAVTLIIGMSIPNISNGQRIHNNPNIFSKGSKESAHTSAFQSQHRGAMYPHQAMVYGWDMTGGTWDLSNAEQYIYYPDGKNMYTYSFFPDYSDTISKQTTHYDMYGFMTYQADEGKMGPDNWLRFWGMRSTITYFAPIKLESRIDEFWDQSKNNWNLSLKTIYTHNGLGLLTNYIEQEWDSIKSSWINSGKYEFLYDSNNKNNEMIGYYWIDNTWQKGEHINVSWFVYNPYELDAINIDSAVMQEWDTVSSQYVNMFKINVIRDANGGTVEIDYDWLGVSWVPNSRYTEKYDAYKNYIGSIGEEWNGSGWDKQYEDENLLTYVSGNVTEKIERSWQQGDSGLTNSRKYVYSEFNSINEKQKTQLKAYPQPFNNYLIIEIPENVNQNTTVVLTDLNGKTMIRQILPNATRQTQLDVSGLEAGSYILTMQTSNSKLSKLLVKW